MKKRATYPLAAAMLLAFSGCSSVPKPDAEMAAAQTALHGAKSRDAALYAPVALDRARNKYQQAEGAIRNEEYTKAARLARESQADAELAQALCDAAMVKKGAKELEDSLEVLQEELERSRSYHTNRSIR